MPLLAYQIAMGQLVRSPNCGQTDVALDDREKACLEALQSSAGYRFTVDVQRSWCVGRLERAASFTLSVLPDGLRKRLLDEWTNAGGGTSSFFASESEAFLTYIAQSLPDPSHELTACQLERATLRANEHARDFALPDLSRLTPASCIARNPLADLVVFHGDPREIIEALLRHRPLPPISLNETAVLFAPGIPGIQQVATQAQRAVWELLDRPLTLEALLDAGSERLEIEQMLRWACLE